MGRRKAEVDKWDVEELKETLTAVDEAMKRLRASGISDRALAVLVVHAARGKKLNITQVLDVLHGLDRVREFVFPRRKR